MDFTLTPEQEDFRKSVRAWVNKEFPKDKGRELEAGSYPFELWNAMADQSYHAIGIPEEYGGQGSDVYVEMLLMREMARSLGALAWIWGVSSFAGSKLIAGRGTEAQKGFYLPRLARGEIRFAFSVTEPGGGTDVLNAMRTKAIKVDGGWRINGQKQWSTSAHVADYIVCFAITDENPPKQSHGKSVFLVPNPSDGLEATPIPTLGERAMGSCMVYYDDVFVPDDNVIGEVGKGWYSLLYPMNYERVQGAACCLGMIDGVLEDGLAHLKNREAWGKPLGALQILQHYIADIALWQKQTELVMNEATWLLANGKPCGVEAAMAKVIASENCSKAADLGIQMLGGMGYSQETHMQRYWRDSRVHRLGPISNEMARNMIAESFDLPRSF